MATATNASTPETLNAYLDSLATLHRWDYGEHRPTRDETPYCDECGSLNCHHVSEGV